MTITHDFKYHLNVRDQEGNVLESGVSYTVFTAGSATAATIYGDPNRTSKTNPVTTTVFATDKGCVFWAATATVDVMLEAGENRVLVASLAPGSEHNVVINTQDQGRVVRASLEPADIDCALASAAAAVVLIPAVDNPRGLIILSAFGRIIEAFAGDSEDQGVITVSDESDNSLFTLTPTNAGADAIDDYVLGFQIDSTATGAALLIVAAGEYVDAVVTTLCSGANLAGKMRVYITYIRL